jgi:hypothetical protein
MTPWSSFQAVPIMARARIWAITLSAVLTAGMAASGAWLAFRFADNGLLLIIGWAILLFFAGLGLLWLIDLVRFRFVTLIINDAGITDLRLSRMTIPWSAIDNLTTWSTKEGDTYLVLKLDKTFRQSLRLTVKTRLLIKPNQLIGVDGLWVGDRGLDISIKQIIESATGYWQKS